jgi:hypothetical protein
MQGESPINMMRAHDWRSRRSPAAPRSRLRRLWPALVAVAVVIALGAGWTWLWYYAAAVADRTLAGWVQREAAAGRTYSCGSQTISGFPFRIEAHCVAATAKVVSEQQPFAISAQNITFSAQVYDPTLLIGDVTGPLTLAQAGQPPSFVANWSRAQLLVHGLPPEPDSVAVALDQPHLARVEAATDTTLFTADSARLDSRIIAGSASNNPVIDIDLRFNAASAPTLHPLLAAPLQGEIDAVLRGFKDLSPKPWTERFREMQASGGGIEIKSFRIDRADATVLGAGTLTVNEHGKLDGLVRVAIVGIEHIVPQLGLDKVIGQSIDRLTGAGNQAPQGLGALDQLVPGLRDVVRQTTNENLIDDIKKMGQQTEIDNKPAIVLPLRFADGAMYLGLLPLGDVPPLF